MELAVWGVLLVVSIVFHELSHGLAAYMLGDDTAKRAGRLSLNPLRHIDPVWTLLLPLVLYFASGGRFLFAMAKPVPVNFSRLQEPKTDMAIVGFAGPFANFVLAALAALVWKFYPHVYVLIAVYLNLGLGLFNLVPIPPLDGSRVLASFLPPKLAYSYLKIERLGYLALFALYFSGVLLRGLLPAVDMMCRVLQVPPLNA